MLLLLLLFGGLLYLWYFEDKRRCRGMPPGPTRIPLIGNLIQIAVQTYVPSLALHKLAKKYGELMHVRMGWVDCVVISSHEAATEFFNSEYGSLKFSLKNIESRNMRKNFALIFSNGSVHQTLRRFTLRTLRDFGFGKSVSMDSVINEELDKFLVHFEKEIESSKDGVVLLEEQFECSVVSILWRLVSGKSFEINDKKVVRMLELSGEYAKSCNIADLSLAYPWLCDWAPQLTSYNKQVKCITNLKNFLMEMVEECRKEGTYLENPLCLIDEYLRKIEEGKEEEITVDQLVYVLLDLFQAGSDTTSKTISWALLYMIVHPDVQEKAQREIDDVLGADEPITIGMRGRLPYTHAVILETMRVSNVAPLVVPRECLQDFKFRGFTIKKNIPVMINIHAVNLEESNFGPDAESFRPGRFIGEDGLVSSKMVEKMMQFGGGKRVCLGQNLSETSSFVYIASILRKFKLESVGNKQPSVLPRLGLTFGPYPFHMRMQTRKVNK